MPITIDIKEKEAWDPINEMFVTLPAKKLKFEHSLVSIQKWESRWHKSFLDKHTQKTDEETLDYLRCMCMNCDDPNIIYRITPDDVKKIKDYIENPMTATTIRPNSKPNRQIITAEVIYSWMVLLEIPFECKNWHLNQLLTLIEVVNEENNKSTKKNKSMPRREAAAQTAQLNAARRAKSHSGG